MLPDAVSNVLHREIKRLHALLRRAQEGVASLADSQYAGMALVQRRMEKLEMDSADYNETLKKLVRGPKSSFKAKGSSGRSSEVAAAGNKRKATEEAGIRDSDPLIIRSPQTGNAVLEQTLERVLASLESSVAQLWTQQFIFQQELDWLKSEYIALSTKATKNNKEIRDLKLMVKSGEESSETFHEGQSEIHIDQQQPMVDEDELTTPGGISKVDRFRHVTPTLSVIVASSKTPERKSNIDYSTEEQSPTSPTRSMRTDVKGVSLLRGIEERQNTTKSIPMDKRDHGPKKEHLKRHRPGGLTALQRVHQVLQPPEIECKEVAEDVCGADKAPPADDSPGNVSSDCVPDENTAKTDKVLEAYGFDV